MTVNVIKEQELLGKNIKVYGTVENPLFLAKDVAEWISYDMSSINKMLATVDDDEKLLGKIFRSGQLRDSWLLTEEGLYEVLMQSTKPIAKQFKKGVKEILKDIRKNGFYATSNTVENILNNPDNFIQVLTKYKEEKEARIKAETQIALQAPKVEYYDALVDRNGLINLRDTAKAIGINPKAFVNLLLENRFIYRDKKNTLKPYAQYIDLFELKEWKSNDNKKTGIQTLVNQKGREKFLRYFNK